MRHILECHEILKTDFTRARNCSVFDSEGRRYIDLESGTWCTALGHGHPRINRAIRRQLRLIAHTGYRYPTAMVEDAARAVLDILGMADGRCVFLCSGSEAVEFCVQAARRITGRPLSLTFKSSFLGSFGSGGAKSADEWHLLDWNACADPDECLRGVPFDRIGTFVFEPGGSGIGGLQFPPAVLVESIAARVKEAGGIVVANEVTTGMGRTGRWFGFQHYGVRPDIAALGKGLGNGYPVSAAAMTREAAEMLEATGLRYVQSHQNDPLGCATAREVIAVFKEGGWVERGAAIGAHFLDGLKEVKERYSLVKEARGRGMLLGLELRPPLRAARVFRGLLDRGFIANYYDSFNMLRFDPPLTIGRRDVERLMGCLDGLLRDAHGG
jgi:acetylornithine/N-succinyldiaminopimelate aminotransferase